MLLAFLYRRISNKLIINITGDFAAEEFLFLIKLNPGFRTLLCLIEKVTVDDLNRVGDKYIRLMFDSAQTKTAVVCDPSKADEIKTGFSK